MHTLLLANALLILIVTFLLWLLSVKLRDASIVDIFWGLGFVIVAWASYAQGNGYEPRRLLLCLLITVWGVRLAIHLFRRNHGKGEDYRYRSMRQRVGAGFQWLSLFIVFWFQGLLIWLISLPAQLVNSAPTPAELTWLDGLGVAAWLAGFAFETIGDWQLMRFKAEPGNKGKLLEQGLWRYTRHPNYFGDALLWWGHWLVALATPYGWLTIFSPLLMTLLLLKVSGVALLEKSLAKSKPGYEDYVRRTSAFVPWLPKQ
jgi:steroid 5-alpha reductase family enzyme